MLRGDARSPALRRDRRQRTLNEMYLSMDAYVSQSIRNGSAEIPRSDRSPDHKIPDSAKDMFARQFVEILWKQCSAKLLAERRKKRADELRE
jgi:hypothetical protein